MDKQQLLQELKAALLQGELDREDLLSLTSPAAPASTSIPEAKHASLSQVMYYLGGAIVFLGIAILLGQNWEYFNAGIKVAVTLGSAFAAFITAVLLLGYPNLKGPAQAFFLVSGLVLPLGMYVTVDKLGFDVGQNSVQLLIWLIMFGLFLTVYLKLRLPVLALFAVLFATGLYSLTVDWVAGQNFIGSDKVLQYKVLFAGLSYLCLGYFFAQTDLRSLTGFLYGFGVLAFLGAAMALGGWSPNQNAFWELAFPFLVFGVIVLSVYLKSRAFLVFGSLFLVGYIFKLTGEYFQESLGWPLALVIAGFLVMLVGYYAVRLGKRYFPKTV